MLKPQSLPKLMQRVIDRRLTQDRQFREMYCAHTETQSWSRKCDACRYPRDRQGRAF